MVYGDGCGGVGDFKNGSNIGIISGGEGGSGDGGRVV